jgi:hypothetical protein
VNLREKYHGKRLSTDEMAKASKEINDAIKELENIRYISGDDSLLLKWGGIKSFDYRNNPKAITLLDEYYDLGVSLSAMTQKNTERQKEIICELIDVTDGVIQNDWDGEYYTKEDAKEYIRGYSV